MIKLIYCITKKPNLSDAEFFHHWQTIHGPIGARIPRLRKLVQSHRIHIPGDKHPPPTMASPNSGSTTSQTSSPPANPRMESLHRRRIQFHRPTKVAYLVTEEHIVQD